MGIIESLKPVLDYCAEEVGRQYYGSHSVQAACSAVPRMFYAWMYANEQRLLQEGKLTLDDIIVLGQMIEPEKNKDGLRTVGVRVGDHVCPPPAEVPGLLKIFIEQFPALNAEEAYFSFEEIHPFVDGNGRVGKIVLNWKNNTLDNPIWPTNKWGILNP